MSQSKWEKILEDCFEKIRLIERCQQETKDEFAQFCEFIAEPAFETIGEALKSYGVKAWYKREGVNRIRLDISFIKSKEIQFCYEIYLPPSSIQLKPQLIIRGRAKKNFPFTEWKEPFMADLAPENILKISKEELIEDILNRYRDFMIEALTSAE